MPTSSSPTQNPRTNLTTLGALWIIYGILRLVAAILLLVYTGTATVMFGALLTRVPDPATLMTTFHNFYIAATLVTALSGLFALMAGTSLLTAKPFARGFSLVAAFLSLSDLPLGTTMGIYTLIIFLP
jgi:hypothetical protein